MGLIVEVFKNPLGDCTNNGITKGATALTIVNVDGPFEPRADRPAAMLVIGNMPGHVRIVPAALDSEGLYRQATGWAMMGGNYAATSDSRWVQAIERLTRHPGMTAVPVHDRYEY
jgi:hypothetical protein